MGGASATTAATGTDALAVAAARRMCVSYLACRRAAMCLQRRRRLQSPARLAEPSISSRRAHITQLQMGGRCGWKSEVWQASSLACLGYDRFMLLDPSVRMACV